jgi:hypothetical protein
MTESRVLTAEEILGAQDVTFVDVIVPEWKRGDEPGIVRLRSLTGEEAVQFSEVAQSKDRKGDAAALILATSIVDDDGDNLFTPDDVKRLKKKCLPAIVRIQEAALELNGLNKESAKATKNV